MTILRGCDVSDYAQMLYTASGRAPSHLYMLLIILLILTQDASFAANVHKVQLTSVPWYKERLLNRTSLGASLPVVATLDVYYISWHESCMPAQSLLAPFVVVLPIVKWHRCVPHKLA